MSKAIFNSRMFVTLLHGFASGLPLALTGSTLQAWFAVSGINVATIGALSLVGQPYAFKFIWAPLLDRYIPPFLGRRRGWIIILQLLLVFSFASMSIFTPQVNPWVLTVLALLTAFFSASQDIAIDAYRTELLLAEECGMGSALYTTGYRLAMLISGGGALVLAEYFGWHAMYLVMSGLMFMQIVVTWLAPEEVSAKAPSKLIVAIIEPLREFFSRKSAILILLFVISYKLTDAFALSLGSKFLIDLGFSLAEIGIIYKGVGIVATVAGGLIGGLIMLRVRLYWSLLLFGLLQAASNLLFAWLAVAGKNITLFTLAVGGESFCSGLSTVAFMAFLMSLCDKRFTATQFALFSSVAAIGRVYVGAVAGIVATTLGVSADPSRWYVFYLCSFLIAFPSFILLVFLRGRNGVSICEKLNAD